MTDESPAKIYSDQGDIPIYISGGLPFKDRWRVPDYLTAIAGGLLTAILVTLNISTGKALHILVVGVVLTIVAVWLASRIPPLRPSLTCRASWWLENLIPRVTSSHQERD